MMKLYELYHGNYEANTSHIIHNNILIEYEYSCDNTINDEMR